MNTSFKPPLNSRNQYTSDHVDPFVHGFDNDTHIVRASADGENFLFWSATPAECTVDGVPTIRWHVFATLYGLGFTECDVARMERNGRWLPIEESRDYILTIRDHLARQDWGLSVALLPL